MKERIRERAQQLGFDDCRFAAAAPPETGARLEAWLAAGRHGEMGWMARSFSKRIGLQQVLPGARTVIVLSAGYAQDPPVFRAMAPPGAGPPGNPPARPAGIVARYARHRDYHDILTGPLRMLTEFLGTLGGEGTRSLWYADTGPVLERELAQRAGLGFIGKHTNLIGRTSGNWILLAEILTTLELTPDDPERNRCGSCARCLAACPTGAITAPFQLDARRCISYLTIELKGAIPLEFRRAIGSRIFGCDDCLAVCPWNRFAAKASLMRSQARPDLDRPDLVELLGLDQARFKQRFAGTPLLRAKRRGLLRNVCVALGNTGDRAALPALQAAAADPEPLIAEHAAWAIREIELRHPVPSPTVSSNPPPAAPPSFDAGSAPAEKKAVDPRMHSAEHILTGVMISVFDCGRPVTTHLEKRKSKADYRFHRNLAEAEIQQVEQRVNGIIAQDLPVTEQFLPRPEAARLFDLARVPTAAGETIRIVRIGDFDACPCIGPHVDRTGRIGRFHIVSTDWAGDILRVRFKLAET